MNAIVKTAKALFIVFSGLVSLLSFGQNSTIQVLTDLGTRYDYAYSIALQPDGKVLVAGDAWGNPCIIRFDTTGMLDNSFGSGGKVIETWDCGSNPADGEIEIQNNGKIVLGTRYHNGANTDFLMARYHDDGSPDASFGENGKVITPIGGHHDWCNAIAIQSDGKILAGGSTDTSPEGDSRHDFALVRYHADGSRDASFGNNGIVITHIGLSYNVAYSLAIQHDGKIIMAGEANDSIFSDFAVVRYHSDGSLDNSFGDQGIVRTALSESYDFAKSVVVQDDEKILVAGSAQNGLSNYNCALVRYNTDGLPDETFGTNGVVISDISNEMGNAVALQPDHKIVLAGLFTNTTIWDFAVFRYHPDGALDNSFGTNGLLTASFGRGDSEGNALAIGADGEILLAGSFNHGSPDYFDFALLRLFSSLSGPSLSAPTLISPADGATGQSTSLEMTWSSVPGAISYNIQISASPQFDPVLISHIGWSSNSLISSGLNSNTSYYWRVSGTGSNASSEWSDTWAFATGETTGIDDMGAERIKVYPLPLTHKLFVDGIDGEMTTVSIYSIEGRIIKQVEGVGIKEIDFTDIPNGIYLLGIFNFQISYTRKIVKQ